MMIMTQKMTKSERHSYLIQQFSNSNYNLNNAIIDTKSTRRTIYRDIVSLKETHPLLFRVSNNDQNHVSNDNNAHWSDPNLSDLHPEDNIESEFDDSGISEEFKQVINYMKYVKNCGLSVRMTEVVNWLIKRKEISDLNTTEDDDIDLDLLMNMGDPTETAT